MPFWFVRGLRRGVVTTRYPVRADESASGLPTPPAFRPEALTRAVADGLAAICPSRALARESDSLIFDAGACTACGRCGEYAPGAVTASGEFELATTARSHLIKRIPLVGEVTQ
jgi:formate hydrogenlyase subunit 6/NADH:ubiquinone oxidoreductase subunit I